MKNKSRYAIRAGSVCCIVFERMPKVALAAIRREFGSQHILESAVSETALVKVAFDEVEPPVEAEGVGRNGRYTTADAYIREGRSWAKFPIGALLNPEVDFTVQCSPDFDVLRLVAYIVEPVMRIRALLDGNVFVHSSSVVLNQKAYVFTAWGNTGKTNLALELCHRANGYLLSDDWTLISADGRVSSYPRPLNVMNYNADLFPELFREYSFRQRVLTRADRVFRKFIRPLFQRGLLGQIFRAFERAFEMVATTHIPIRFSDEQNQTHVPHMLCEVQKSSMEKSIEKVEDDYEWAASAAACFVYENMRILDRLQEFEFANSDIETDLRTKVRRLYFDKMKQVRDRQAGIPLLRVFVVPSPTRETVRQIAQKIVDWV